MELRRLNAKKIRVGAKNGMTMNEFCEKYDCSVEQFSTRVTQLYGGDMKAVSQIINQIEGNAKLPRPRIDVELARLEEPRESVSQHVSSGSDAYTDLMRLQTQEANLIEEISNLECRYNSLMVRHKDYLGQLSELESGYEKLREELIAKGNKFDKLAGLINESAESINTVVAERRQKALALAGVREKLASLEKVHLEVNEEGTISAPGNAEFSFNETGSENWFRELLKDEDTIGNLRFRDVRVLARLLAIIDNAAFEGYPEVEVNIASPELAEAYLIYK